MKVKIYKSTSRYSFCQKASVQLPTKLHFVFNTIEKQLVCIKITAVKTNSFFVRFTATEKRFTFSALSFFCFSYRFAKNSKKSNALKVAHFFPLKVNSNFFSFEFFSEKEILKIFIINKSFNFLTLLSTSQIKDTFNMNIFTNTKVSWFRFFGFFYYNDIFQKNTNRFVDYWNHFTTKRPSFPFKKIRTHNFYSSSAFKNQKFKAKRKNWKKKNFRNKYSINRRSNFRKKLKRSLVFVSFLRNNTLFNVYSKKVPSGVKKKRRKTPKYSRNRFVYTAHSFKDIQNFFFANKKYTFKVLKKNFKNTTNKDTDIMVKKKNSFAYFHSSSTRKTFSKNKNKTSAVMQHKERENILINILGTPVTLYRINAISFARFAFDWERKEKKRKKQTRKKERRTLQDKYQTNFQVMPNFSNIHEKYIRNLAQKNRELDFFLNKKEAEKKKTYNKNNKRIKSSKFLRALQDERRRRYRYIGVYIQDLIRLSFISFYFKYAAFLIRFFAFTLRKLPRNRKETKYLRFLIKLVKVFGAQREEIVGLRVRFQGRVNRWRRTKHILGQKGMLPLHTYTARVAYGYAQAITRKGAFGRRIWIAYEPFFAGRYKNIFFQYFQVYKNGNLSQFNVKNKIRKTNRVN